MKRVLTDTKLPPSSDEASKRQAWFVYGASDPTELSHTLAKRGWRNWEHETGCVHIEDMPEVKLVSNLREFAPVWYEVAN